MPVFEIVFVTSPTVAIVLWHVTAPVSVDAPVTAKVLPHATAPLTSKMSSTYKGLGIETLPVQLIVMVPLELATMIRPRHAVLAYPKSKIELDVAVLAKTRSAVSSPLVPACTPCVVGVTAMVPRATKPPVSVVMPATSTVDAAVRAPFCVSVELFLHGAPVNNTANCRGRQDACRICAQDSCSIVGAALRKIDVRSARACRRGYLDCYVAVQSVLS